MPQEQKRDAGRIASPREPLHREFDSGRVASRPFAPGEWNNPGFYLRAVDRWYARNFNTDRGIWRPNAAYVLWSNSWLFK